MKGCAEAAGWAAEAAGLAPAALASVPFPATAEFLGSSMTLIRFDEAGMRLERASGTWMVSGLNHRFRPIDTAFRRSAAGSCEVWARILPTSMDARRSIAGGGSS